jgi:hypothetical protein
VIKEEFNEFVAKDKKGKVHMPFFKNVQKRRNLVKYQIFDSALFQQLSLFLKLCTQRRKKIVNDDVVLVILNSSVNNVKSNKR